jgi:hypothetical protein
MAASNAARKQAQAAQMAAQQQAAQDAQVCARAFLHEVHAVLRYKAMAPSRSWLCSCCAVPLRRKPS